MTGIAPNIIFIEDLYSYPLIDESSRPRLYADEIKAIFCNNEIKDTLDYARNLGGQKLVDKTLNTFKAYIDLQA